MNSNFGTIAFGTVMGGAGSRLAGGNFWQGAVTGLIVSMMNHAMHNGDDSEGIDPPGKKGKTASGEYYGGDGSCSFMDNLHRFIYETDQWNPIALAWDGIESKITGTDRYGNRLSGFQSRVKICSALPVGRFMGPSESIFGHIFRNSVGHINPTSMASKMRYMNLFKSVASNPNNLVPTSNATAKAAGILTYQQTYRNGSTVWVQTFNGQIRNAGVNLP